jgi:hypothetical protein
VERCGVVEVGVGFVYFRCKGYMPEKALWRTVAVVEADLKIVY